MKCAAVLVAVSVWVSAPALAQEPKSALRRASHATGVPYRLLRAVAWTESRYNPAAVSPAGALGLMQLMPVVLERYGVTDPMDIHQNALAGARLLRFTRRTTGSWRRALAAYNWGIGNVRRTPAHDWPRSVSIYVMKVCRRFRCVN